jgi:hypothetical protein
MDQKLTAIRSAGAACRLVAMLVEHQVLCGV